SGEGGPTVILDYGRVGSYLDWYHVQPQVARFARVCSYDRGGYGWSDPSPKPRLPSAMAEELYTLLTNAGERPPYVLVGHSFGGISQGRGGSAQVGRTWGSSTARGFARSGSETEFRRSNVLYPRAALAQAATRITTTLQ